MELKELCRLCTMPLKGPHIDCLENDELCDCIRMVYNIQVKADDDFSTKVCTECCEIVIDAQINYTRVMETQKSLKRALGLKSALRTARKAVRSNATVNNPNTIDISTSDVEMIEIIEPVIDGSSSTLTSDCATTTADIQQQKSRNNSARNSPIIGEKCEESMIAFTADAPKLFAHLNSFQPYEIQKVRTPVKISAPLDFTCFKPFTNTPSKTISTPKTNLSTQISYNPSGEPVKMVAVKSNQSFFQIAKDFCGHVKQKAKVNIDSSIDELTKRMESLQLGIPKMLFASQNIKSNLSKFGSLMDICTGF